MDLIHKVSVQVPRNFVLVFFVRRHFDPYFTSFQIFCPVRHKSLKASAKPEKISLVIQKLAFQPVESQKLSVSRRLKELLDLFIKTRSSKESIMSPGTEKKLQLAIQSLKMMLLSFSMFLLSFKMFPMLLKIFLLSLKMAHWLLRA